MVDKELFLEGEGMGSKSFSSEQRAILTKVVDCGTYEIVKISDFQHQKVKMLECIFVFLSIAVVASEELSRRMLSKNLYEDRTCSRR